MIGSDPVISVRAGGDPTNETGDFMLSARTRGLALATVLVIGGAFAVAVPAHAGPGATIAVESDIAFIDEPLVVSGTCPTGTETAVVTLVQDGEETAFDAVGVAPDRSFEASLDLTDAVAGPGTAHVDCVVYGEAKPLGSASTEIFVIDFDLEFAELEVAVSPRTVAMGGTVTVSATCPEDATHAVVLAGNEEADEAFFTRELTPAPVGRSRCACRSPRATRLHPRPVRRSAWSSVAARPRSRPWPTPASAPSPRSC